MKNQKNIEINKSIFATLNKYSVTFNYRGETVNVKNDVIIELSKKTIELKKYHFLDGTPLKKTMK